MNFRYINRLIITAFAAVVVAMSEPSARADELTDVTVTMPRSGKEIFGNPMGSITATDAAGNATYSQTLRYASGSTPSFSGNTGGMDWRGADNVGRSYAYSYDGLGRLVSADYSAAGSAASGPPSRPVGGTPSYSTSYTYGPDSRPLTVRRQGLRMATPTSGGRLMTVFGEVDNLTFTYTGPLLTKVSDTAERVVLAGAADFDDGADMDVEYTYDADGRLTSDANKGITSISYNAIGLPAEISFSDGSAIISSYGADGALLRRVRREPLMHEFPVSPVSPAAVTQAFHETADDHIGPLTYRRGALWRLDTGAGYISADGRAHYYIRDHQGNVRQVTDSDGNVGQDNHYYPYGMLMGESSDIIAAARNERLPAAPFTDNSNTYLFGSKEYLATASANILDFSARTYDPATLLFHTPDPLRDNYLPVNSYLYCGADPVNRIDPTGMQLQLLGSNKDLQLTIKQYEKMTGGQLGLFLNDSGMVIISPDSDLNGKLSASSELLRRVIEDEFTTTLNIVNDSEEVGIADITSARVDIGDIMNIGDDKHVTSSSILMHETWEQYYVQTKSKNYINAHNRAIKVENAITGLEFSMDCDDRLQDVVNEEISDYSELNIKNTKSKGEYYTTTILFFQNNVKNVIETKQK